MNNMKTLKTALRLLKFVKPFLPEMIFSILNGVFGHITAVCVMSFSALLLCNITGMETFFSRNIIILFIVISALIRGISHYFEQYSGHDVAFRLLAKIRSSLFDSLRDLAPAKMVDKRSGDIVTSLMGDIEIIEVFFAHTIAPVTITALMFIILNLFFFAIHPVFSIVASIGYLSVAVLIPILNYRFVKVEGKNYRNNLSDLNSSLIDTLQGLKELILFDRFNSRIKKNRAKTSAMQNAAKDIRKNEGLIDSFTDGSIILSNALLLIVGIFLFSNGLISKYEFIIVLITYMSSFAPFIVIPFLSNTLSNTFAAAERIFSLEDEENPSPEIADSMILKESDEKDISVNNVNFGYKKEFLLQNVSINIKKGEKIAIQGESGSGKTTILRLLLRFWDVTGGEIKIGSENVKNINLESLRNNISMLSQETYIFNKTISENIALGKADATIEDIKNAAEKAGINQFIESLPNKYETLAGALGDKMSGGERQRIGIARIILRNSDIVLFDEMTSNLDILNEQLILKTINKTMEDKTIITVTHRESVATHFDKIFFINKGKLEQKK